MTTFFRAPVIAAMILFFSAPSSNAQVFSEAHSSLVDYLKAEKTPGKACEAMNRFKSGEILKTETAQITADGQVPGYCRVSGTISPEIAFEVNLPAKWNGRLYMIGNGGHAGEALDNPMRTAQILGALKAGFAVAQTDAGHDSRKEPGASFALNNPQKAVDYAYRAVHLTATTAKAVIKDYYNETPSYSYWNSCSNGGRQGLIEAQRYPEDFDGVIANAPWVSQTGFTIGAMWNQKAFSETPVSAGKLTLLANHVMEKCDAVDGLKDGLIDDPRKCDFDPARDVPSCPAGTDNDRCLTSAQAAAVAKVYGGPVSNGRPVFPGFMPGSEALVPDLFGGGAGSGWMNMIVGLQPDGKSMDFMLAEETMRYLVSKPPQPDYDYRTFDYDRDTSELNDWGRLANADDPDLSAFRKRGGKLLMTYGWADAVLQPQMGIDYYEQVLSKNGPAATEFARLFMIPGMSHCSGGIGPDQHDPMTAIINWGEKDKAPDSMTAKRIIDGKVTRSRPLCPYPQVARYTGEGSIDDAANFRCTVP